MTASENPADLRENRMRHDSMTIFQASLAAVDPRKAVLKHVKLQTGRLMVNHHLFDLSTFEQAVLLGAGKAGAPMAAALEELLGGFIAKGVVAVKYDHVKPLERVSLIEAGHPVPDINGLAAAKRVIDLAREAKTNTLVFCLLSGGGSALLTLPAPGISLSEKQEVSNILLGCGATIHEVNTIRKHLSAIKGGHLAAAVYPARLISLVLSDVVGDELDTIASGPAVPDSTTFENCMEIIQKHGIQDKMPPSVLTRIKKGISGEVPETVKPGDPVFKDTCHAIVGCNMDALKQGAEQAEALGYRSFILSDTITGEAARAAVEHACLAKEIKKGRHFLKLPVCVLSGGETTVTLKGDGKGGRNQQFALKFAMEIQGEKNIVMLSGGTDGTDGPTDAAGAVVDTSTVRRAKVMGLNPDRHLETNNAYPFLEKTKDLYKTGPTFTNVMDVRVMLIK